MKYVISVIGMFIMFALGSHAGCVVGDARAVKRLGEVKTSDDAVFAAWTQVENVYERKMLIDPGQPETCDFILTEAHDPDILEPLHPEKGSVKLEIRGLPIKHRDILQLGKRYSLELRPITSSTGE